MGKIEDMASAGDLDGIADKVRSGAASERITAAWKLGAHGDEGVRRLMPLLLDGNLEERWRAAMGLTRAGKAAVDPLIGALASERPEARSAAAWALQEIGDRKAVKPLIKALEDAEDSCRWMAAACLFRLADEEGLRALEQALEKENEEARGYIGLLAEGS
jgi:HEAT repeat protein